MGYYYLKSPEMRETYKRNIISIVKAAHGDKPFWRLKEDKTLPPWERDEEVYRKIDAVVVAGGSGAPVGTFFRHVWKNLYPNEKLPHFYSLEFIDRMVGKLPASLKEPYTEKEIEEWGIKKRLTIDFPNLMKDIKEGKNILVLDEYSHSGTTLYVSADLLKKLGAKEVYTTALCRGESNVPEWYHRGGRARKGERRGVARELKQLAQEIREELEKEK